MDGGANWFRTPPFIGGSGVLILPLGAPVGTMLLKIQATGYDDATVTQVINAPPVSP